MLLGNLLKKNKKNTPPSSSRDALRSPEVLGVNLVKDELIVFFDWNKHIFLSIIVVIVVGLFVFEIYSGLGYWEDQENKRAEELKVKTDILKMEVVNLNNEHAPALTFRDKSGAFSDLLENHVYFTQFFDWLQKNTLSSVKYSGFSGDLTGVYTLNATAPTYAEASWQAKAFLNNEMVKNVQISTVSSAGSKEGGNKEKAVSLDAENVAGAVSFSIALEINPEVFRAKE